ncbi:hypothetical protein QAD02_000382 [Eretmocerus hayati]|uniref:Uncharacterized protein n=1 Tax=Eretmocerus hayati TaxID=131215 RepID=A0ACC2NEC3_9HYME|nr:hypothetical protein QAD02_000382 [Eretmocerus hayati]
MCSVAGCLSRSCNNSGLSFHKFPPPNGSLVKLYDCFGNQILIDQLTAWKRVLNINKLTTSLRVCSLHFRKDDYLFPDVHYSTKRPLLTKTAVPLCNLMDEPQLWSVQGCTEENERLNSMENSEILHVEGSRGLNVIRNGKQAINHSHQYSGRVTSKRSIQESENECQGSTPSSKGMSEREGQSLYTKMQKIQDQQDQNMCQDGLDGVYVKQEKELEASDQDEDHDSESEDERDLRKWIIETEIPHHHSDELLKILRRKKMPNLPATTKIFLLKDSHFFFDDVDRLESEVRVGKGTLSNENEGSGDSNHTISIASQSNPRASEIANVNCKTAFEVAVMHQLEQLHQEVKCLSKDQKVCKVLLNDLVNRSGFQDFKEKHDIDIPIKDVDEFLQFNNKLMSDQSLKRDLCEEFKTCLDKHLSITRTFVGIMKKFMSKDVALKFTAVRESRDGKKIPFQQLEFCKCMYGFIRARRMMTMKIATNDGELRQALSEVFTNVKKWT